MQPCVACLAAPRAVPSRAARAAFRRPQVRALHAAGLSLPPERRVAARRSRRSQKYLAAGSDAFPEEKEAEELGRPGWASWARACASARAARPTPRSRCWPPEFKGGRLTPADEVSLGNSPQLEIFRARTLPAGASPGPRLVPQRARRARRRLRLASDGRVPHHGDRGDGEAGPARPHDRALRPRRRGPGRRAAPSGSAAGRCAGGAARTPPGASRSGRPSTTCAAARRRRSSREATEAAFGANPSFRRQLVPGQDEWAANLDGLFMPRAAWDTTGVSVGDSDGDGLDDVYVSQPEGLPNRLFRNNGDGTFADVTERGRRRRARPHVAVALRRRGQRRRPGPDPRSPAPGPLLFVNDGKGHFTPRPRRVPVQAAACRAR